MLGRAHAQLTLQQQLEGTREDLRTTQEELEMYRAQVSALPPLCWRHCSLSALLTPEMPAAAVCRTR